MRTKPKGLDLLHGSLIRELKTVPRLQLVREYFLNCPSDFCLKNSENCSKVSCTECQLEALGLPANNETVLYVERVVLKENV